MATATNKLKYGTQDVAIAIDIEGTTDGAAEESTSVDNSVNLFVDTLVAGTIRTGSSAPTVDSTVDVFVYGTNDGGTRFSGSATGVKKAYPDTGVPAQAKNQLKPLGSIVVSAATGEDYEFGPWSVASKFGGVLPEEWGIVMYNETGTTLDTTAGNFDISYQGVHGQAVE